MALEAMATLHEEQGRADALDALKPVARVQEPQVGGPGRALRWLARNPRAVPIALFLAIVAVTALGVFAIESNARAKERAELSEHTETIVSTLERRASSYSAFLRAGAALFAGRERVSEGEFQQFVNGLRLDDENRGVEGLGWVRLVNDEEVASSDEPVPAPVNYFAPETSPYRAMIGFDMASEPNLMAAMSASRNSVRPTASRRILLQGDGVASAPGFDIFMPVFRADDPGSSAERELIGYIFSRFHAGRFLQSAVDEAIIPELGVRLYDSPEAGTSNLLATRASQDGGGRRVEQSVEIADRELLLVIEAPNSGRLAPLSMVTLAFGLALASLLMLIARLLTRQAQEDQTRLAFFEEQHSIRNSLTRELNHRVKNTLANVLSIMSLTRRRTHSLDEFAKSLEGRIRALSATHDLLTGSDWGTTAIRNVIEAEMRHFRFASDDTIVLEGPDVELAPNDALSFGLAIHELATNAAKYGALSVPEGRVEVRWELQEAGLACITWVECDGPEVGEVKTRGFGTELLEKIVVHELDQPVDLTFHRAGVRCVIRVPVRRRGDFHMRAPAH